MNPTSNRKLSVWLLVLSIFLSMIACNLPGLKLAGEKRQPMPSSTAVSSEDLVGLSEQQIILVSEFSWPDSFSIIESDDETGRPVRYEVWNYYDGDCAYTFVDGVFQFDEVLDEILPDSAILTPYRPNQFALGVSPDVLMIQIPGKQWNSLPYVDGIQEGMQINLTQQLLVGYFQNRLVYVDAMIFIPEVAQ